MTQRRLIFLIFIFHQQPLSLFSAYISSPSLESRIRSPRYEPTLVLHSGPHQQSRRSGNDDDRMDRRNGRPGGRDQEMRDQEMRGIPRSDQLEEVVRFPILGENISDSQSSTTEPPDENESENVLETDDASSELLEYLTGLFQRLEKTSAQNAISQVDVPTYSCPNHGNCGTTRDPMERPFTENTRPDDPVKEDEGKKKNMGPAFSNETAPEPNRLGPIDYKRMDQRLHATDPRIRAKEGLYIPPPLIPNSVTILQPSIDLTLGVSQFPKLSKPIGNQW